MCILQYHDTTMLYFTLSFWPTISLMQKFQNWIATTIAKLIAVTYLYCPTSSISRSESARRRTVADPQAQSLQIRLNTSFMVCKKLKCMLAMARFVEASQLSLKSVTRLRPYLQWAEGGSVTVASYDGGGDGSPIRPSVSRRSIECPGTLEETGFLSFMHCHLQLPAQYLSTAMTKMSAIMHAIATPNHFPMDLLVESSQYLSYHLQECAILYDILLRCCKDGPTFSETR